MSNEQDYPPLPQGFMFDEDEMRAYADAAVAAFLERSGQWLTNEATRDHAIREAVEADRAARGVPDGFVLVPITDLEELRSSINGNCYKGDFWEIKAVNAMLEAEPPTAQQPTKLCDFCSGSGEAEYMTTHLGPDDYSVAGQCMACGGSGVEAPPTAQPEPRRKPPIVSSGKWPFGDETDGRCLQCQRVVSTQTERKPMTIHQAEHAADCWQGQAGGRLCPQLTANELAGLVNEFVATGMVKP